MPPPVTLPASLRLPAPVPTAAFSPWDYLCLLSSCGRAGRDILLGRLPLLRTLLQSLCCLRACYAYLPACLPLLHGRNGHWELTSHLWRKGDRRRQGDHHPLCLPLSTSCLPTPASCLPAPPLHYPILPIPTYSLFPGGGHLYCLPTSASPLPVLTCLRRVRGSATTALHRPATCCLCCCCLEGRRVGRRACLIFLLSTPCWNLVRRAVGAV